MNVLAVICQNRSIFLWLCASFLSFPFVLRVWRTVARGRCHSLPRAGLLPEVNNPPVKKNQTWKFVFGNSCGLNFIWINCTTAGYLKVFETHHDRDGQKRQERKEGERSGENCVKNGEKNIKSIQTRRGKIHTDSRQSHLVLFFHLAQKQQLFRCRRP